MSTLAVIFNPTKIDRADLEAVVEPARVEAGWGEVLWLETQEDDPGVGMAREAVEKGVDVVLGVGGDGTIRCVAEGLRDSGVPLALAPQGTGNLLARNLDLTLDNLPESVDAAFNGKPRKVDLGVARWVRPNGDEEERVFLVAAGVGLDAQIMSTTDEKLKKRVGMLAYVKAGVEALFRNHRMRLTYRLDESEPERARLHTILIGNCGSIGGNVLLLPDAAVDDGVLDVVGVFPRGVFGWPRVAWKVLVDNAILHRTRSEFVRKRRDRSRELNYQQCREIEVTFRRPEEIELDGDHFGEITSLLVQVEDGGLLVQMPADWTADED
ncbi:diacylglycerol kinase family protein [Tessaracoccus sp. MC1756]|uniref:diacylglycerol/lipid kinase family protein n=1 Tax=Tessaracoccus sp. MC1756 TaxID=2760311 RepID=UPI0016017A38|nr:diacylglycerol kinase family protein [Tessaracoccus sp. MC1756]MBB1510318.1 NAD(+)/NADH kinase [Tessaracoccus sp. MC1756]